MFHKKDMHEYAWYVKMLITVFCLMLNPLNHPIDIPSLPTQNAQP